MRPGVADKQLDATIAASAFQKQWFSDLRRRVFDERTPYALVQADVPFDCSISATSRDQQPVVGGHDCCQTSGGSAA
jgi:hypothetical protein